MSLSLGLGLFLGSQRVSGPAPIVPDYTITSDADWATIPAPILANGGNILVMPGSYTSKTITADPTGPLLFYALNYACLGEWDAKAPSGLATSKIDKLIVEGVAGNIIFEGLEITSSDWQVTPAPAVQLSRVNTSPSFKWCWIHGGYRGNVSVPFNPTTEYPEYACIIPQFTSGVVTSFIITRPNVVDLLADGTYSMVFNNVSGSVTFSVAPVATFTVVAGTITGTTLTSGGTSTAANSLNAAVGILSKVVTWAGQKRMAEIVPYGFQSISLGGTTSIANLLVEDCLITDLSQGVKTYAPLTSYTIQRNKFARIYQDYISVGTIADNDGPAVDILWNFMTHPMSASGDCGDPHADVVQFYFNDQSIPYSDAPWYNMRIIGNVHIDGVARGGVQGAIGTETIEATPFVMEYMGNVVVSKVLANGFSLERLNDSYIFGNMAIRYDPTDTVNNVSAVNMRITNVNEQALIGNNIYEGFNFENATNSRSDQSSPNTNLGLRGATIAYSTIFANPTGPRTTLAEIKAAYTTIGSYAARGPFGSLNFIDHAARTVNYNVLPSLLKFTALVDQTASSSVSSAWRKLVGGPATQSISIAGTGSPTYQIADDAAGTNVTTATSASGTVARGKWIRVNLTNDAGSAATVSASLIVNGQAKVFSSTTVSTAAWPVVAFDGSDRAVRSAGALGSNSPYCTFALNDFYMASNPAANTNIYGVISGSGAILVQVLTTGIMQITLRDAAGAQLAAIRSSVAVTGGSAKDILFNMDISQDTFNNGATLLIDGVDRTTLSGSWSGGPGITIGWARTGVTYAFGGTAATMMIANTAGLWMDITTRVDFTDPVKLATLRAADLIGTNGEGPTGSPPVFFYVGNAAQLNDVAGVNFGSGAKYIMTGAVTDVSGSAWP